MVRAVEAERRDGLQHKVLRITKATLQTAGALKTHKLAQGAYADFNGMLKVKTVPCSRVEHTSSVPP